MKSYQQFFAELKRRKVFRVAAIYGATSFVVLQAAELVLPRLGLPDWTVTFMLAILLLAFPVALILAWAFEVTPDGVQKTEAAGAGEIEEIVAQPAAKRWGSGLLALLGVVALPGRAMDELDGFARRMAGSRVLFWAPFFDPLQDDPRFQELLRAGNLGGRRPVRAPPD